MMTRVKFETIAISDNNEALVDLRDYPFVLEMVYFNNGWSDLSTHKLRWGVAEKLLKIQESFNGDYHLKIWDAWRPREVQNRIYLDYWQRLANENPHWDEAQIHHATEQFVTKADDPRRIPPHATGGTIDLTLVDRYGVELDMGTVFDHFGPEAMPFYFDEQSEDIAMHRRLLRDAMTSEGFTVDDDEWWHFDYGCQLWAVRAGQQDAIYGEVAAHF